MNFTLDHAVLYAQEACFVTEWWYAHTNNATNQTRPPSGLFWIAAPN
jgi:hypothetical protein